MIEKDLNKIDWSSVNAMRSTEARRYLGNISKTAFYNWRKEGRIPDGIKVSPRCALWLKADLDAALEKLKHPNKEIQGGERQKKMHIK